ncbi:hypothetical protein PG990_014250 [Apiospora arundinis]
MTSYYRDAESMAKPPTAREQALMDHKLPITPIDQPVLPFAKPAKLDARSYMTPSRVAGSREIAEWNRDMFLGADGGSKDHLVSEPLQYRTGDARYPVAPPIRPGASTIITTFSAENGAEDGLTRALDLYIPRFKLLAATGEMVIFYTNSHLKELIESLRPNDPYWHVVCPWDSVWDIPNNRHQHDNFSHAQPDLFQQFMDSGPIPRYNVDRLSAAFNAKAYCIFDGVQRAPFGAEGALCLLRLGLDHPRRRQVRHDGLQGPGGRLHRRRQSGALRRLRGRHGRRGRRVRRLAGPGLAAVRRQRGVLPAAGEGVGGAALPGRQRAGLRFGHVELRGPVHADGRGHGRQRALRGPRGVRHVLRRHPLPPHRLLGSRRADARLPHPWPIRDCHSGRWGPDDVAALVDPVQTLFCRFYEPRRPNLPAVHGKKRLELMKQEPSPPPTPAKK